MTDKIKVYFATNRNNEGTNAKPKFGKRFHQDGPGIFRVGYAEVKKTKDDHPDKGYILESTQLYKEIHKKNKSVTLGSQTAFKELSGLMAKEKRDVLVFLHGFSNTFASGIERAAQLSDVYKIASPLNPGQAEHTPIVFAFAWPSDGQIFPPWRYHSDRADAEDSGRAMARALLRLRDFFIKVRPDCGQRIHLVAHSMGNWALRHMIRGLRSEIGEDRFSTFFENAFLMCADEDNDALDPASPDKLGLLPRLARYIHVYHSQDDGALVISDKTKFNPDRLGAGGPKNFSVLPENITAIDCSLVDRTKLGHVSHQYYRINPEVIDDVKAVLASSRPTGQLGNRKTLVEGRRYRLEMTTTKNLKMDPVDPWSDEPEHSDGN